jgi:integrase
MPKLTKRYVDAAKPKQQEFFLWDDEIPGFGVRVRPSSSRFLNGTKTFILQYRNAHGNQRRMKLGRMGIDTTAERARKKARDELSNIADGRDPQKDKKDRRDAETVNQLADRYMTDHASVFKKASSQKSDDDLLRLHIRPSLGIERVEAITRRDVSNLHSRMKNTPGAANRTLALLSKMMNLAEKWGIRPDGSNPCRHVDKYPERKMQRFLSEQELARLGQVLSEAERTQTEMTSVIAAIRLLIFTGARTGEILNLKWDQVDFENAWLNLDDSKTGAKLIYLAPGALEVLKGIERQKNSPWVIQGRDPRKALVNIRKPWGRIRKHANLDGVRLHDLRHSFASFGAASGLSLPMIGKLLGHSQPATTARYAHLAADPMRKAVSAIGEKIAAAMKPSDNEVIELATRIK